MLPNQDPPGQRAITNEQTQRRREGRMGLLSETQQLPKVKKALTNTSKSAPPTAHATIQISPEESSAVESRPRARQMRVLGILYRDGMSGGCADGGLSGRRRTVRATRAGSTTAGTDCAPPSGTRRCSLQPRISIPLDRTVCRCTIEQSPSRVREYWRSRSSKLYGRVSTGAHMTGY